MKKKTKLKDKERVIIEYINRVGGGVTAHEISEHTDISYVTVQKYLKKLTEEEILTTDEGVVYKND